SQEIHNETVRPEAIFCSVNAGEFLRSRLGTKIERTIFQRESRSGSLARSDCFCTSYLVGRSQQRSGGRDGTRRWPIQSGCLSFCGRAKVQLSSASRAVSTGRAHTSNRLKSQTVSLESGDRRNSRRKDFVWRARHGGVSSSLPRSYRLRAAKHAREVHRYPADHVVLDRANRPANHVSLQHHFYQ